MKIGVKSEHCAGVHGMYAAAAWAAGMLITSKNVIGQQLYSLHITWSQVDFLFPLPADRKHELTNEAEGLLYLDEGLPDRAESSERWRSPSQRSDQRSEARSTSEPCGCVIIRRNL